MLYYLNISGVIEPLRIAPTTLGWGATRGVAYQQQFTTTGGTGSVTWTLSGGAHDRAGPLRHLDCLVERPQATGSIPSRSKRPIRRIRRKLRSRNSRCRSRNPWSSPRLPFCPTHASISRIAFKFRHSAGYLRLTMVFLRAPGSQSISTRVQEFLAAARPGWALSWACWELGIPHSPLPAKRNR